MNIMVSLLSLIILALNVFAIVKTLQTDIDTNEKLLWVVILLLLPGIGLALWYFIGPLAGKLKF